MKKIVIFGAKDSNKSFLYREIQKCFSSEKNDLIKPTIINYTENIITIEDSQYKIIDALPFRFASRRDGVIDKNISILNDDLISSSDLIFWVINIENEFSEDNFNLQKYLEKKKKKYVIIFLGSNISSEKKEDYLNNYQQQKILKKNVKSYFLSTFYDKKNQKEFTNFIIDKFNFEKDEKNRIIHKEKSIKLTIFGPPNSGKSTLLNALVLHERSVVSEIAGTTKEDVFTWWSRNEVDFQLKDTEGIINEKRNKVDILVDCQIAWVVVDVTLPITKHVLQVINLAEKCDKSIVIILNKIDIVDKKEIEEKKKEIRCRLKSLAFVPIIQISAKTKKNFCSLFRNLDEMIIQSKLKFSKSFISEQFKFILEKNPPSNIRGKRLKIYYVIHEKGFVHKFVIFSNNPNLVHFSYCRYIINSLRKNLSIHYLPIRLFFKKS